MTRRPIPITRHISLIYRYAQRFLSGRLRDFPLEAGQLPLMLQLYRYPGVTQEQLAQRLAKLGTEIEVASVVAKRQHRLSGKGGQTGTVLQASRVGAMAAGRRGEIKGYHSAIALGSP